MSTIKLPEIPESWFKLLAIVIVALNLGVSLWTREKAADVQTKQATNAAKIDETHTKLDEAKADVIRVKAAVIKE